jgi:hypothetical protein
MTRFVDVDPLELLTEILYVAEGVMAVGVPEIAPVSVLKDRPTGSEGEMLKVKGAVPLLVGV